MKKLDYNAIKWEDLVYYDETSPTFLRWKVERRGGAHRQVLHKRVGDIAGSTKKKKGTLLLLFQEQRTIIIA